MGFAFGAAIVGSLVTVQATNRAVAALGRSSLPVAVREEAIASVRTRGPSARPAITLSPADARAIDHILSQSLGTAARIALLFAVAVVSVGGVLTLLIPRHRPSPRAVKEQAADPFEPIYIDTTT